MNTTSAPEMTGPSHSAEWKSLMEHCMMTPSRTPSSICTQPYATTRSATALPSTSSRRSHPTFSTVSVQLHAHLPSLPSYPAVQYLQWCRSSPNGSGHVLSLRVLHPSPHNLTALLPSKPTPYAASDNPNTLYLRTSPTDPTTHAAQTSPHPHPLSPPLLPPEPALRPLLPPHASASHRRCVL